ncbi:STAS/SEC14 domain-containing protein [Paenibacillus albidus]|uniref:STAS/SEC14 domain-containing protein n=1 Tax=Paenibacillus albidus TaxID=2041023 RepID=UPI001BE539D2|nr:STAS/SEC14 domain-containing protein [Paenibacillus albidus]MBT2288325.1 STAS/SEC14 domain-containing protein [Paenibacillus albidus]
MIVKSPGGSIFPYYYKGGEIHCLKYGSFHSNSESLFSLMKAEEAFILGQHRRLAIWVDLYETQLTREVMLEFADNLIRLQSRIRKLAIVGDYGNIHRLRRFLRKQDPKFTIPIQYYDDPEEAKTWLVMG